MTVGLHELIDDRQGKIEEPQDFMRLVSEIRNTAEEARTHEVSDEDRDALARAAEFLTTKDSPVQDELDALIATGAASAVIHDPRIEKAFAHIRDKNFPIDDTIPDLERQANVQSREQFETARHMTDQNRSFGHALITAGAMAEVIVGQGTESELIHRLDNRANSKTLRVRKANPKVRQQIRKILYSTDESSAYPSGRYGLFRGDNLLKNTEISISDTTEQSDIRTDQKAA